MQKLCCVCTRQQFSASLVYFVTSLPPYLHQFSSISGGNCISRVWFPSNNPNYPQHPPYVWRTPFPPQVQCELITTTNPSGTITNSNLELVVAFTHAGALAHHQDIWECTVATFSDSTPLSCGGPRPPSLPRAPLPICSTQLAYTNIATAIFSNVPTSPGLPTCWPILPHVVLTCPMMNSYVFSPPSLLIHRIGRC